ncbi:unnamed protein product, partial [Ectocarpus fasciculatus]
AVACLDAAEERRGPGAGSTALVAAVTTVGGGSRRRGCGGSSLAIRRSAAERRDAGEVGPSALPTAAVAGAGRSNSCDQSSVPALGSAETPMTADCVMVLS